ncbi:hypothetical protein FIBSPDRAFT_989163 [Athelia psychrophila]|uniref:Uncharacterized protein n=1 Tax=Athelia psychrophila TaxID=1759441 RepID=A0A165ZUL7_9AGAM|nr:hypothetical protein FIBSPDRAFT_989163 [Fibularhizoctonia sp. CBS 109695]
MSKETSAKTDAVQQMCRTRTLKKFGHRKTANGQARPLVGGNKAKVRHFDLGQKHRENEDNFGTHLIRTSCFNFWLGFAGAKVPNFRMVLATHWPGLHLRAGTYRAEKTAPMSSATCVQNITGASGHGPGAYIQLTDPPAMQLPAHVFQMQRPQVRQLSMFPTRNHFLNQRVPPRVSPTLFNNAACCGS